MEGKMELAFANRKYAVLEPDCNCYTMSVKEFQINMNRRRIDVPKVGMETWELTEKRSLSQRAKIEGQGLLSDSPCTT
jgi:hypothetical protein